MLLISKEAFICGSDRIWRAFLGFHLKVSKKGKMSWFASLLKSGLYLISTFLLWLLAYQSLCQYVNFGFYRERVIALKVNWLLFSLNWVFYLVPHKEALSHSFWLKHRRMLVFVSVINMCLKHWTLSKRNILHKGSFCFYWKI